jgi:hypothetical protein
VERPLGKEEIVGLPARDVVARDVPREPVAFQSRAGLAEALERMPGGRVSVVFAVTAVRGVGKTQVAAGYARRRIAEGWRLVAWVDASDEASLLAGLAQAAALIARERLTYSTYSAGRQPPGHAVCLD